MTAPSPENLTTVFEFLLKGFDALKYTEHQEYELIQANLSSGSIAPGAASSSSSSSSASASNNHVYGHGGSKQQGGNIVRVNVFRRDYRQTIQYVAPEDYHYLSQAELLVIDEAAAIPLPVVKKLMGPYMTIMSSTIHGYEGTGRSLSLKLLADLKKNSVNAATTKMQPLPNALPGQKSSAEQLKMKADLALDPKNLGPEGGADGEEKNPDGTETRKSKKERRKVDIRANAAGGGGKTASSSTRLLTSIGLDEPIRYGAGDGIEKWLNDLCCLDASEHIEQIDVGFPLPKKCKLHMVNRDAMFSYHKATEVFLKKVVGLFVTSHYKNTPDDLLLLADAPAHFIFVLLAPDADESDNESDGGNKSVGVPDVLVAIHIAIEGCLVKSAVQSAMRRGLKPQGDLIPWQLAQHYCDSDFANLAGARIVRIATHPMLMRKGYASEAVSQLCRWFDGKLTDFTALEGVASSSSSSSASSSNKKDSKKEKKLDAVLRARDDLPALLEPVSEMAPPFHLDYIGTCYGLTQTLYDFWRKAGFASVYLAQKRNLTTGEHSIIMVRPTDDEQSRAALAQQ